MPIRINDGFEIVTAAEWGANGRRSTNALPRREGLGFHWEGPQMGIRDPAEYPAVMRAIERFHEQRRSWSDFAYNWAVSPHGQLYEGRGEFIRSSANGTKWGNDTHEAVVYLAGQNDPFTEEAKRALVALRRWRTSRGLGPNNRPHRSFKATECPGAEITAWINQGMPTRPVPPPPGGGDGRVQVGVRMPELRRGSRGKHVEALQALLNVKAGQGLVVDGNFGLGTERAVIRWQDAHGLTDARGVCSAQTWHTLFEMPTD